MTYYHSTSHKIIEPCLNRLDMVHMTVFKLENLLVALAKQLLELQNIHNYHIKHVSYNSSYWYKPAMSS